MGRVDDIIRESAREKEVEQRLEKQKEDESHKHDLEAERKFKTVIRQMILECLNGLGRHWFPDGYHIFEDIESGSARKNCPLYSFKLRRSRGPAEGIDIEVVGWTFYDGKCGSESFSLYGIDENKLCEFIRWAIKNGPGDMTEEIDDFF